MLRRELTLVNHRIEHLTELQSQLDRQYKKKPENVVLRAKSPASRHREVRQRIGFDSTADLPDLNSITESDSSSRVWRVYSPNQWDYNTPDNQGAPAPNSADNNNNTFGNNNTTNSSWT